MFVLRESARRAAVIVAGACVAVLGLCAIAVGVGLPLTAPVEKAPVAVASAPSPIAVPSAVAPVVTPPTPPAPVAPRPSVAPAPVKVSAPVVRPPTVAPAAPAAPVISRVVRVAGVADVANLQSMLDQCVGPILFEFPGIAPVIAEHDFCGGTGMTNVSTGQLVSIVGGGLSGTYVVNGARRTVPKDANAAVVNGMGTVVLQTCVGDQLLLVGLTRQ